MGIAHRSGSGVRLAQQIVPQPDARKLALERETGHTGEVGDLEELLVNEILTELNIVLPSDDTQAVDDLEILIEGANGFGEGSGSAESCNPGIRHARIKGVRGGVLQTEDRGGVVGMIGAEGKFVRLAAVIAETKFVDDGG